MPLPEERVWVSILSWERASGPCDTRTAVRGPQLILRDVHSHRPVQFDRIENLPFLSEPASREGLDGTPRTHQLDEQN